MFDGKTGGELWSKNVTFYLHSKNVDMSGSMVWAEQKREPVTARTLGAARGSHALLAQLAADPEVLSYHFWGFLNVSLAEDAWLIFAGVDIENGFAV